MRKIVG